MTLQELTTSELNDAHQSAVDQMKLLESAIDDIKHEMRRRLFPHNPDRAS